MSESDLKAKILALEDFLNEPLRHPYPEPPELRDYRHEAYRLGAPLCAVLLAKAEGATP